VYEYCGKFAVYGLLCESIFKRFLSLFLVLQLINNVGGVFTKFVREGKCTIRLCEPPVDVCVSKVNVCLHNYLLIVVTELEIYCGLNYWPMLFLVKK